MTRPIPAIAPAHIGFDFDGVIADIGEAFVRLACTRYGCDLELDKISSFQVDECIDLPREAIEAIFDDILRDSIGTGLRPIEGAIEALKRLGGHAPVTIITARPRVEPVRDWLEHHFDRHRCNITLISSGRHDDKEQFIRQHNIVYFIDDRVETCIMLAESGLKPMVFTQPWNRGQHNLPAVNTWAEIIDLLDI
jgi:uncharacterized HAD superfamily protein